MEAEIMTNDEMNIVLDSDLVENIFSWHSGQVSPSYSLASTGLHNPVSLEMIKDCLSELNQKKNKIEANMSDCCNGCWSCKQDVIDIKDLSELILKLEEFVSED